MNKKINKNLTIDIILIILITIIFSFSFLRNDIYFQLIDGGYHLNRLVGIKDALLDHQLLPKIYPYTNNGYGYASALFYCDFFLYPFALIYYLGCPLLLSFKLMYIFYTLIGSIIAFYCFNRIFKEEALYRTVSIIFLLGQYRFLDAYVRLAFGEYLALCFLPLLLYAFYKVLILKEDNYLLLAFSFVTLLFSHNLSFALYCFIYLIFMIIFFFNNHKEANLKLLITTIKAALIAILLSLWFLLPMVEAMISHNLWIKKLTSIYSLNNNIVPLKALLDPFMTLDIWTSNPIGYILLLLPIFIFFIKDDSKYLKYLTIIGYIALLASFNIIPMYLIKPFNGLQFAFRFNIIAYPFLAISASYVAYKLHHLLPYIAIIYTLIISMQFNYQLINAERIKDNTPKEVIFDYSDILNKDYNEKEIVGAEYLPITEINDYLEETTFIKRVNDDGKYEDVVYEFNRYFLHLDFNYDSDGDELLMMPLTYYKGYKGYALKDGNKIPLEIVDIPNYEKVGFYTLDGNYEYHIYYGGTIIQHLSLIISFSTLLMIVFKQLKTFK